MSFSPVLASLGWRLATPSKSRGRVRFGIFELDCLTGELRRNGASIKLQPQPAKVLTLLVSRAGEVITRQELADQIWGSETFVDFERGLNFAIRQIRTMLEDDADHPLFVETLPKRGYRFIATVEDVDALPEGGTPRSGISPSVPERLEKPAAKTKWVAVVIAGACLLALIAAILRYARFETSPGDATPAHIQSIAVLPLVSLSSDPSQEYFSDGLTDELITELAKTGSLRVISRTSVITLRNSRKSAPEIGRQLRVDALVEGTVERDGGRVRIRAQLVRAATDQHLWAESYDRDAGDLLSLEREVARDIALQIGHNIAQGVPLTYNVPERAHEDYLKGRYYWNKRTEAGLRRGIEYFQNAVRQEPNYALAYVGLADSHIMLANWGFAPPGDAYLKAKEAALKALQVDNQLAEAHTSLAYVTLLYDRDWASAEARFRQAIALNPNYASAHHFYSILLMTAGRQAEAVAEIKRAQELDPLSLIVQDVAGWIYYEGRQYDEAIQQYSKILEMDPNYPPALLDLGTAYLRQGRYQEAMSQFERARAAGGENGVVLSSLAQAHALSGNKAEARFILQKLRQRSAVSFVSLWDLSLVHVTLSENKKAIALLQKATEDHVGWVIRLGVDPALDSLREDPEFPKVVLQVGVPLPSVKRKQL